MIGETEQTTRDAWEFVNRFSPLASRVSNWRKPLADGAQFDCRRPSQCGSVRNRISYPPSQRFFVGSLSVAGESFTCQDPDTYRLRFLRGDRLHYRFWGQLMRWAIASDLSSGNRSVRIRTGRTLVSNR